MKNRRPQNAVSVGAPTPDRLKEKATALRVEALETLKQIRQDLGSVERGLEQKSRNLR
jgi:hypothetical protein